MKAKFTKDGRISVKLDDALWKVIESAFRTNLLTNDTTGLVQWCLSQECLEKIEARSSSTLKFRKSEFFTLFSEQTFAYVDTATTILAWNAMEGLRKEISWQPVSP